VPGFDRIDIAGQTVTGVGGQNVAIEFEVDADGISVEDVDDIGRTMGGGCERDQSVGVAIGVFLRAGNVPSSLM